MFTLGGFNYNVGVNTTSNEMSFFIRDAQGNDIGEVILPLPPA